MILALELNKTYGRQNEDIAKKNKISKINLTVNSIKDSSDYSNSIQETVDVTADGNTQIKLIATNFSKIKNEKFSSYIGAIEYKTYTVSLDLNDSKYATLKTAKKPVPHTETYTGNRAYRNMTGYTGNTIYSLNSYNSFKSTLEDKDIIASMKNFKYTSGSGSEINLWTNENDFVKNKYSYEESNYDVVSEWSNIIQNANDIIKEENNFSELLQYTKTNIITWNNDGNTLTFSIQIPYGIYFWNCNNVYDTGKTNIKLQTEYSADPIYWTRYLISETEISFTTSVDVETEDLSFFDGNREYSANSSFMFTKGNMFGDVPYYENFATDIYNSYKNGKIEIKIKYPIGEIVDKFNNSIFYSSNFGLVRKIGNDYFNEDGKKIEITESDVISSAVPIIEGCICELLKNGESIYKNTDGSTKYFLVQSSNMIYNGFLLNELNLIETTEGLPEYTLTTNKSDIVTRISSPIAGAKTGTLKDKDKIYKGDELRISITNDIRTYTIKNNGEVVSSGESIYGGETINLTVSGDVIISITYMDWRWVKYSTSFSNNIGNYISGSSGTYSTTIDSANFDSNYGKGLKVCENFSSINSEHRKEYFVESFSWKNADTGSITKENVSWSLGYSERYSEGDISVVDGQSFGFTQWNAGQWDYAIGNEYSSGFENMLSIDCKQDGVITITVKWRYNTGSAGNSGVVGSTEYYNGYIEDIKIYLYQWEYS